MQDIIITYHKVSRGWYVHNHITKTQAYLINQVGLF
jgi:hypothetical protein